MTEWYTLLPVGVAFSYLMLTNYALLHEAAHGNLQSHWRRNYLLGVVAGLLCFIVTGFAGSSLRPTPEFAFLWIAIGMMYGQLARRRAGT